MFIKVEPAEFFMYRVIIVFDLESPNSEDQRVRDYMEEWELEPKYQYTGEFEGSNSEVMQFGGCYLGRHLGHISEIQRNHVERELITAEIGRALEDATDPVSIPDGQREEMVGQLVADFHQPDAFQSNDEGLLEAVVDGPTVRQAARKLLTSVG